MPRILNVTRGFYLSHSAAELAIAQCSAEWVDEGISIRTLTPAEAQQARNKRELDEKRGWAELPDCRFDPPASGIELTMRGWPLVKEANAILAPPKKHRAAPAPFLKFERPQTARPTPDRESLVA